MRTERFLAKLRVGYLPCAFRINLSAQDPEVREVNKKVVPPSCLTLQEPVDDQTFLPVELVCAISSGLYLVVVVNVGVTHQTCSVAACTVGVNIESVQIPNEARQKTRRISFITTTFRS